MGQAKGSAMSGAVRFLQAKREEAEGVLATDLHHYLDGTVSASTWYPEEDLIALLRAVLRLVPGARDQVLEEMGRMTARDHCEGTYRHLIEGGDLGNLGIRAFALWGAMHDTGEMAVIESVPGRARLALGGYAHASEELCKITRGYILEVLHLNEVEVEAVKRECAAKGGPACVWDLIQEKPEA